MDKIKITNLEIFAFHGVMPEENKLGQKFIVSAELFLDTEKAGMSDNLEQSVNYALVCECIREYNKNNTKRLIEAAALGMAENILFSFDKIRKVRIELKKPNPPIHMHFDSVSVETERGWNRAFIAFGSNMGDRKSYIDNAIKGISADKRCRIKKVSSVIETEPYGGVEQDNFLNGVMEIETIYSPYALLDFLHKLENEAGRERKIHWGPRTLDLDILFYDGFISDDPRLTVPHRDFENRNFTVIPMCELAPDYIHPVLNRRMRDFKANV